MFEDALGTRRITDLDSPKPYRFAIDDYIDGRYCVRSQIGRGGMGDVLRVQDIQTSAIQRLNIAGKPNLGHGFPAKYGL